MMGLRYNNLGLWTGTEPTYRLTGMEGGRYEVENAAVESRESAVMAKSDPQKMSIRHLAVTRKLFRVYELRAHQGDVVGEEHVMWESEDPAKSDNCLTRRFGVESNF